MSGKVPPMRNVTGPIIRTTTNNETIPRTMERWQRENLDEEETDTSVGQMLRRRLRRQCRTRAWRSISGGLPRAGGSPTDEAPQRQEREKPRKQTVIDSLVLPRSVENSWVQITSNPKPALPEKKNVAAKTAALEDRSVSGRSGADLQLLRQQVFPSAPQSVSRRSTSGLSTSRSNRVTVPTDRLRVRRANDPPLTELRH